MRLAENRAALRRNLGGTRPDWPIEVLDGGMARAIDDLDRLFPREVITDFTLTFAVSGEVWASGTIGSTVTLANKRIKSKSEVVKDAAGTVTYAQGTDYSIDYVEGTITTIVGGGIAGSTNHQVDYTILEVYLDISSLTDMIRVFKVEYPGGKIPTVFQSFYTWGDFLVITSRDRETQQALSPGEHVWVYYHAKHTAPDKDTDGTWMPHLNEVMLKGAEGYCQLTKAMELRHSSRTRQLAVAIALGELAAISTQIDTALTDTRTQASSAVADMANIDTYIASMLATLASVTTFLSNAGSAISDAQTQAALVAAGIADADIPLASASFKLATIDALILATSALIAVARTAAADAGSPLGKAEEALGIVLPFIETSADKLADVDAARAQTWARLNYGGASLSDSSIRLLSAKAVLDMLPIDVTDPVALVGDQLTFAGSYLTTGLALINQVNIGQEVSETFRRYADTQIAAARMRYDEYLTILGRADRHIAMASGHVATASEWRANAEGYLSEANTSLGEISALLGQISAYQANADGQVGAARAYLDESKTISEAAGVSVGNSGRAIEQAEGYNSVARTHLVASSERNKLVNSHVATASQFVNMAQAKIAEGVAMQSPIEAVLERVRQKIEVAKVYQGDADRRLQEMGYKQQEADRYAALSNQESELADKFEERGLRTKTEFMDILQDRVQVQKESALTPTRQEAP